MNKEYSDKDFWKNYMLNWFGEELIAKWEKYAEIKQIDSVKGKINIEIYKNIDTEKPTIVFTHGIAGYARILLPFTIPLFEKGYNIIAPDLEGYGYNDRLKGDFTWDIHLQNLKDTVDFTKTVFKGNILLGGASIGAPLSYATDTRYNCADGLICWCLWNLADKEFMNKETTTKQFTYPMLPLFKFISFLFGNLRLKTYSLISYDTLTDNREFNDLIKIDPQAGTLISLRGALSLLTQSKPDKDYNEYNKPVLVCQPEQDKMIPSCYTKKTFDEIKSNKKEYCRFNGEHFPIDKATYIKWADCVDRFIRENLR